MLVDVANNKRLENCESNHKMEVESYMKATQKKIAQVRVEKDLVKAANISNAMVDKDILNQEEIVKKSLEFFRDNYAKVAGKTR